MQRTKISSSLTMSRLVYGMWRLGDDQDISPEHVRNKISSCLHQGITSFDQADIYGGYEAEEILGNALKGSHLRKEMEIVTKCDIVAPVGRYKSARVKYYDTSRDHILKSVDASLKLMGIDYIDLLLLHRPDPLMDHFETGAALDEIIASGKVRNVGVSNFKPWDWNLLQAAMKNKLVTNQIELSVLAHEGFTNGDVAFHQTHNTPIMAWSPLAGGDLFLKSNEKLLNSLSNIADTFGVEPSTVAVAWLLAHPANILPVLGTNSLSRIETISQALDIKLDRQTWFEIYTTALGREVA
ncbi:MAG: aldo/keto reductase [Paracoccaceae bacterium]|jgi:predicted oxidoreductase